MLHRHTLQRSRQQLPLTYDHRSDYQNYSKTFKPGPRRRSLLVRLLLWLLLAVTVRARLRRAAPRAGGQRCMQVLLARLMCHS